MCQPDDKNDSPNKELKDELKLLYSLCVSDIAFSKNQQWKITNYVIAVYVAIFGVWKTIVIKNIEYHFGIEFWLFILVGLTALVTGITMINIDQGLLNRSRPSQ